MDVETFRISVQKGETYLLRILNATLNGEHFFKIENHKHIVVAVDASYTKPYMTDVIVITLGQSAHYRCSSHYQPACGKIIYGCLGT